MLFVENYAVEFVGREPDLVPDLWLLIFLSFPRSEVFPLLYEMSTWSVIASFYAPLMNFLVQSSNDDVYHCIVCYKYSPFFKYLNQNIFIQDVANSALNVIPTRIDISAVN